MSTPTTTTRPELGMRVSIHPRRPEQRRDSRETDPNWLHADQLDAHARWMIRFHYKHLLQSGASPSAARWALSAMINQGRSIGYGQGYLAGYNQAAEQ